MNFARLWSKKWPYTESWLHTLIITSTLGGILAFIIIFLEPRDTHQATINYKTLKLGGYAFVVMLPLLLLHFVENWVYHKQHKQWFIYQEGLIFMLGNLAMITSSYFYNVYIINGLQPSLLNWWWYTVQITLPYIPLLGSVWVYLRWNWGKMNQNLPQVQEKFIQIIGKNKGERLEVSSEAFIYAQAKQNYVEITFLNASEEVQKKILRLSLNELQVQVPEVWQVHRSYLVNLNFFHAFEGNTRKREMRLKIVSEAIPVSPKYYENIAQELANSSQKNQNHP